MQAPDGVGEVVRGADLAGLLAPLVELQDGDVVAVTSKVVAKAEGRVLVGTTREAALPGETVRVVARRGATTIVRNRLGLTMAAAGIDNSNVAVGSIVLLPEDPDVSARGLRAALLDRTGRNVGVVVTDTAGRAWREGQTDIAVGAAGLPVLDDHAGREDTYGNPLAVTAPAVADEIAGMCELAQGKLGGRPFAVVRGLGSLVLPIGEDGPGAAALIRAEGGDLFGYGAREAVVRALTGDPAARAPFGSPAETEEVVAVLSSMLGLTAVRDGEGLVVPGPLASVDLARLGALLFAHAWEFDPESAKPLLSRPNDVRLRPAVP